MNSTKLLQKGILLAAFCAYLFYSTPVRSQEFDLGIKGGLSNFNEVYNEDFEGENYMR